MDTGLYTIMQSLWCVTLLALYFIVYPNWALVQEIKKNTSLVRAKIAKSKVVAFFCLFWIRAIFWACDMLGFFLSSQEHSVEIDAKEKKTLQKFNKFVWVSVIFHYFFLNSHSSSWIFFLFCSGSLCVKCDRLLLILSCFMIDFFLIFCFL